MGDRRDCCFWSWSCSINKRVLGLDKRLVYLVFEELGKELRYIKGRGKKGWFGFLFFVFIFLDLVLAKIKIDEAHLYIKIVSFFIFDH